jgi:hypothetical protein
VGVGDGGVGVGVVRLVVLLEEELLRSASSSVWASGGACGAWMGRAAVWSPLAVMRARERGDVAELGESGGERGRGGARGLWEAGEP